MIHIIVPIFSTSIDCEENCNETKEAYSKDLMMIRHVFNCVNCIDNGQIVILLNQKQYDMLYSNNRLNDNNERKCDTMKVKNQPKGVLCASLLAIDYIDNDDPVVVVDLDQIIAGDLKQAIDYFQEMQVDCGIIGFDFDDPRWLDSKMSGDMVVGIKEKDSISRGDITGFYYFRHGSEYVEYSKRVLVKGDAIKEQYNISATINEMILNNKTVLMYKVDEEREYTGDLQKLY